MHARIPQLTVIPNHRPCPPWCVDHDHDVNLCIGARTGFTYPASYPSGVTLTEASVRLMQDPDESRPTISLVLNATGLDLTEQQAEDLAWALLATIGKAGLR